MVSVIRSIVSGRIQKDACFWKLQPDYGGLSLELPTLLEAGLLLRKLT